MAAALCPLMLLAKDEARPPVKPAPKAERRAEFSAARLTQKVRRKPDAKNTNEWAAARSFPVMFSRPDKRPARDKDEKKPNGGK